MPDAKPAGKRTSSKRHGQAWEIRTANSHRALLLAEAVRESETGVFESLNETLFRACFSEGKNIGDESVLRTIAEDAGDVAARSAQCRFRDCRHDAEPGCAVKKAVQSGALAAERLEHFRKLDREARAYERRHDERVRRQAERVWGQLHDEVTQLRKWKGGKP